MKRAWRLRAKDRTERLDKIASQPAAYGLTCCLLCPKPLSSVLLMDGDAAEDEPTPYALCLDHWDRFNSDDEDVIGEIEAALGRLAT